MSVAGLPGPLFSRVAAEPPVPSPVSAYFSGRVSLPLLSKISKCPTAQSPFLAYHLVDVEFCLFPICVLGVFPIGM